MSLGREPHDYRNATFDIMSTSGSKCNRGYDVPNEAETFQEAAISGNKLVDDLEQLQCNVARRSSLEDLKNGQHSM